MTGDEEQIEEHVQVHEHGVNVVQGKVYGPVFRLGVVDGDLIFPAPEYPEN